MNLNDVKAVIFGHAVADALGVPVEFSSRERLKADPVVGMRGHGTYNVPAGTWSDDTSMTLATLDSLAHGLDYEDMMHRFHLWVSAADYTAHDDVFDVGTTTSAALLNYSHRRYPALECGCPGEHDNGNGSLMRILPVALYCAAVSNGSMPLKDRLEIVHTASALTHAHARSLISCGIYCCVLFALLEDRTKNAVFTGLETAARYYEKQSRFQGELAHFRRLYDPAFAQLGDDSISSSGYVVATLEAALWCLLTTDSYAECVLKAVNLGADTDTVAAVAGGLAGLLYGLDSIDQDWLSAIARQDYIASLCESFLGSVSEA